MDKILDLPIPPTAPGVLDGLTDYCVLDTRAFELFGLKESERVLIEDTIEYTIDDFLSGKGSKGLLSTTFGDTDGSDAHLRSYCTFFLRVLKAGFGIEKYVSATIFHCPSECMPYRLVAFTLGDKADNDVKIKNISSSALLEEFGRLNEKANSQNGGLFNQRVARIYDASIGLPTVFMIKPDQMRFWTRSMALQDGDEVALDLFRWQQKRVWKTKRHFTDGPCR